MSPCPGLVVVVGFAMYYFTYDPWVGKQLYLEDFYVMEPYRGASLHFLSPGLLQPGSPVSLVLLLQGWASVRRSCGT